MAANGFHAHEAEQAVLGGLFLDGDSWHQVSGEVSESDFSSGAHRRLFRAVGALVDDGEPVDAVTVAEWLDGRGELEDAGGLPYLTQIAQNTPSAANVAHYARIIRDRAQRRRVAKIAADLTERLPGAGSAADAVAEAQSRLESVTAETSGQATDWMTALRHGFDTLEEAAKRREGGGTVGVATGLPTLDRRTGGLHGPRLWVVAARPSIGKSALTLQMALHAAHRGHRVGIVSLEMGADEIAHRAVANRVGLNLTKLTQGHTEELQAAAEESGKISGFGLHIDDDTYSLGGVVSRITQWRRTEGIDFAVVDHIGLVEDDDRLSRVDLLGRISRALKKLAKRLDMPIVAVSQLNRAVEREKRLPQLADLRDSGNVEQDADICLFLHCDEADEERPEKRIQVGLLKNRGGVRGWLPQDFTFIGSTQQFREMAGSGHQKSN